MKTIEQKAKAYDEAKINGSRLWECGEITRENYEYMFPEIKESEDERIREWLINLVKGHIEWLEDRIREQLSNGQVYGDELVKAKNSLAWLEKQDKKIDAIENFDTEFEKQISRLIASIINKDYKYTKDFVKWTSNALLNYAKYEIEKQGEQKPASKMQVSENLYEHIRNTCACIDDALSSETLADINNYLSVAKHSANSAFNMIEKQGEQKPTYKVEPKFKVGDWVVYHRNDSSTEIMNVYDIRDNRYYFNDNIHFSWSVKECDEKCHLWTIEDAKDGDVLAYNDGSLTIFHYRLSGLDAGLYMSHVLLTDKIEFKQTCAINNVHPATKEQRDLLFQKMKEKGYKWDAEKKELKKVKKAPQKFMVGDTIKYNGTEYKITEITPNGYKVYALTYDEDAASLISFSAPAILVRQKPTENKDYSAPLDIEIPFGAKDSELIQETIRIPNGCYAFIEGNEIVIKKGEKPAAWSEEIEKTIHLLKCIADEQEKDFCPYNANNLRKAAQYLETCRPQNAWKPSNEQMKTLENVRKILHTNKEIYSKANHFMFNFEKLIRTLKKLRED